MIFLIRHGQTQFNREGRLQGRLDSPLTEVGVEQARRMAARLSSFVEDRAQWTVVASPLGRALRTAEIVREGLGLTCAVGTDERLAEIDVGEWEGLTREDIAALSPGAVDEPGWLLRAPAGETLATVTARLTSWLAELDERDGRRRLVVSHGVTGRILRWLYARGAPEQLWTGPSPPQDAVYRLYGGVAGRVDDDAAG